MSKIIIQGKEAREKLLKGLNIITDAVKITIGPKGRNVVIDRGYEPLIANDAGTIAKEIILKDKTENMGAQIIKGVIQKTSEKVGGGRTASAILTHALVEEGLKQSDKGMNMNLIKKGMHQACADITENLKKIAQPCTTKEQLKQVATISTESEELGEVIAEVVHKVGKDGIVTVEDSQSTGTTTKFTEGLEFEKGYISPYMVTNPERMEAVYEDVQVYITDKKISAFKELVPVLERVAKSGKTDLLIICEDLDGEALNQVVINKLKGNFNIIAVKAPGFGDNKKSCLEDLCAMTGAQMSNEIEEIQAMRNTPQGPVMAKINMLKEEILGMAKKIIVTKDTTKIIEGKGDIKGYINKLKTQQENTESKMLKDQLDERIAKLSSSVAVIKVGANSETELKYLKLKIEDGVNEAKRALEEGIVPGGDVVFINCMKDIKKEMPIGEERTGYEIVVRALNAPLKQIIQNADGSSEVIIDKILDSDSKTIGYNAITNSLEEDMFKAGIIDAVKVSRTVLENAVSAAAMFLSIECAISEEESEDKPRQKIEY